MQPYERDPYWEQTPQPYDQSFGFPYQYPPAPTATSGMAITSLVLGILAVMFCWIPFVGVIAWPLCLVGGGFGLAALGPTSRGLVGGHGLAVAGLVCSLAALVVCALYLFVFLIATV